jgi:hypothetical protein
LRADQATGQTVTGDGALRIVDGLSATVDLSKATAGAVQFDLDSDDVVDTEITVAAAQTLKIGGNQLGATTVTVEGNLDVYLGTGDEVFDLDALVNATGEGLVTVYVTSDLDLSGNTHFSEITHFVVDAEATLTLDPSLADNAYVSGTGTVHVTDLGANADALIANLENLTATSVTSTLATTGEFTGVLGTAQVTVAANAVMTISAAKASDKTITGAEAEADQVGGSIVITDLGTDEVDLSSVTAGAMGAGTAAGTFTTTIAENAVITIHTDTDLGTLAVTLETGAIFGLTADQADLRDISGPGTAEVNGDITGDNAVVDLTHIEATLSFLDEAEETATIEVGAEKTLVLNAYQASGQSITGAGSVQIADDVTVDVVDFTTIIASLDFTEDGLDVAEGATLELTATQASGSTITGGLGDVRVHGLQNNTDLSLVNANVRVVFDENTDISLQSANGYVDAYDVTDYEVTFSTDQLNNATVYGDGSVVLVGESINVALDLRDVSPEIYLDSAEFAVGANGSLQITGTQANFFFTEGYTITGGGTVEVTTADPSGDLNLSGILTSGLVVNDDTIALEDGATLTVNASNFDMAVSKDGDTATVEIIGDLAATTSLDLTGIADGIAVDLLGTDLDAMQLGDGAQLMARAEQLAGESVEGTGTIVLTGDASAGLILSAISVNLDVSGVTGLSLTGEFASTLPQYAVTRTLTLSYAQAPVENYNAGLADVVIKSIDSATNADLTFITANSITAMVDSSVNFTGDFGSAEVSVDDGEVLTTTAAIASGVTISGLGTLNISGNIVGGENIASLVTVNLTNVSTSALTFNDVENDEVGTDNTIVVGEFAVLILNADLASGQSITGAGAVSIVNAQVGTSYMFDDVTADDTTVTFADAGTVHADTILDGIHTVVLHDADLAGVDVTTMTAAQADGVHFTGSTGALQVTAADGTQTLFGTAQDDLFIGGNLLGLIADRDEVDLGASGGADTIKWTAADYNQMKVLNFTALANDGSQEDVLDFSLLSGLHNPNGEAVYEALVTDAVSNPSPSITSKVVGLTDLSAGDSAASVESLFKSSGGFLNNLVNKDNVTPTDMVFLIANKAENSDINVWHWVDSSGGSNADGNLQGSELTLLGTLSGVNKEDLANLNVTHNFIV